MGRVCSEICSLPCAKRLKKPFIDYIYSVRPAAQQQNKETQPFASQKGEQALGTALGVT